MTREALVAAIKQHEGACRISGAGFKVMEIKELAPGVIAVRDNDNEYTLYFDQSIALLPTSPLSDTSEELPGMIDGVGFIECVTARNFAMISEVAKHCLIVTNWHAAPEPLLY